MNAGIYRQTWIYVCQWNTLLSSLVGQLCACVPAQVNEASDGLIDELHYLQDQVNNVDAIAVIPAEIQDQLSDNRVSAK